MSDFAIFIALPEELGVAIDVLRANGEFSGEISDIEAGQRTFLYELGPGLGNGKSGEVFLIRGMGNTKSAAFVGASLARDTPPRHALLVGISGSLSPDKVKLGDVVISSHVKYYAPDKIKDFSDGDLKILSADEARKVCDPKSAQQVKDFRDGKKPLLDGRDVLFSNSFFRYCRSRIYRNAEETNIDRFMKLRRNEFGESRADGYFLHSGAVLGSNMVLDSKAFVDYIVQKNYCDDMDFYRLNSQHEFGERCSWDSSDLLAVDMESYGFFSAFEDMRDFSTVVQAVAVRGISDLAAGKSELDMGAKGQHRKLATTRAVQVAIDYLRERYRTSRFEVVER